MKNIGNPLTTKKLRKTKARQSILKILSKEKDRAFSAEELHEACNSVLHIDLSTVYRTMHTLAESGMVTKSVHHDGKAYFQLAEIQGAEHHHRIVCSKCNASADIAVCPLHNLEDQIMSETGFVMTSHSIELTGLCPSCKAQAEEQTDTVKHSG